MIRIRERARPRKKKGGLIAGRRILDRIKRRWWQVKLKSKKLLKIRMKVETCMARLGEVAELILEHH